MNNQTETTEQSSSGGVEMVENVTGENETGAVIRKPLNSTNKNVNDPSKKGNMEQNTSNTMNCGPRTAAGRQLTYHNLNEALNENGQLTDELNSDTLDLQVRTSESLTRCGTLFKPGMIQEVYQYLESLKTNNIVSFTQLELD